MASNLSIDPQLLSEAVVVGGFSTKKDTVNQALIEFIQRRKQKEITELFGKLPADDDYDYKKGAPVSGVMIDTCVFLVPTQELGNENHIFIED